MYCADTTFIVDLLRNRYSALQLLRKLESEEIVTTPITIFEVLTGAYRDQARPSAVERAKRMLETFPLLELTPESVDKSAQIMARLYDEGQPIEETDCLIAGAALSHKFTKIITRNKDHFERVPGVEVITY